MTEPIRLLASACLLGEPVRYDGQHKHDPYLTGTLGRFVEFVRVCPEADCGLPVPREAMRLVGDPARPRLVAPRSGIDHTDRLETFARRRLDELAGLDLCGYVCKKGSPSSGMERVKVFDAHGLPHPIGTGIFTRLFRERFPLLPVEEEGRLHDPALRESFLERVFALRRWRDLKAAGRRRGALVEFHADHKLQLLTHGRPRYTALGRLVAAAKDLPPAELFERYETLFLEALAQPATVPRTTDVLLHALGHFRPFLAADEKQELVELFERYRHRLVPLVVPITLVAHHVRKHGIAYLARQTFLAPHPIELMLRNHG